MPDDPTPAGPQPTQLTATQAVDAIAAGRLSAEAYVSTLLDRADKLSHLGAFITLNRAGAVAAAKTVDERRQAGQLLAPLAGLPIVVKDNINTIDFPTTGATAGLAGFRPNGIPVVYWDLVHNEVRAMLEDAKAKLTAAGVTFVTTDLPQLRDLLDRTAFPVVLHEATLDLPAYLAASGSTATLQSLASLASNPEVRSAFNRVLSNDFGPQYRDAINVYRPRMRALRPLFRGPGRRRDLLPYGSDPRACHRSGAGIRQGLGERRAEVDTFTTIIRYADLGSTVGLPGLTLPVGLGRSGLPVGMALDGPVGSDKKLLSIGLSMEALFGTLPAPKLPA